MTRYRPVPRTLSDIMRRLSRRPSNAPELMTPEQLCSQRAPMLDPAELFKGVTVRPAEAQTREQVAQEGMKTPESLFGEQRLALPGAALTSPQELDLLPGQPLPEIWLEPLPEPLPGPEPADNGGQPESGETGENQEGG
ncbi:MAG TPA: hypothetical protein V6D23_19335 [Candidatus Obscuribacterales bacterium]